MKSTKDPPKPYKITLSLFLVIILGVVFYLIKNGNHNDVTDIVNKTSSKLTNTEIPAQFEDLTIPYLRNRTYKSSLGSLDKIDENASYTSYLTNYISDGLKINGLLTIPTGTVPKGGFPAIVFVHGYIPPQEYNTMQRYVDYVDYLARNGFVVFKIDLRGNGNSQGQASGAYFSSGYVIDTLNAYAALQNASFVNSKEIGLWGHSMAGNVVLRAMTVEPTIPATVIWAGAVYTYIDQREFGIHDPSYQTPRVTGTQRINRESIFQIVGTPSAQSKFWHEVAPTTYLNDLKGAIQIDHALDDNVVSIKYSEELNALLNKTDVPHEFYTYPTGGHNISGPSFDLAMQRTVQFFKKYLNK